MRILLAAPDRDLLECYRAILQTDFGETVTAFDGTQVLSLAAAEPFDLVVMDCSLPRIEWNQLLKRIRQKGIPVIALTDEFVSTRLLTEEPTANAWLRYPFKPERLRGLIRDILEKAASAERWEAGSSVVDVSAFRFAEGPSLSAGELDVLRELLRGAAVTTEAGAQIRALNAKLAAQNAGVRIRYRAQKGFELVKEDE